jgi:hypothetical protein
MQVNVPNLRTAFEAAADKTGVPCNPFYTKMRDAVFNTCLQALGEYDYTGKPWLHIVSAAPGAGKTTLTNAFIAALVETVPGATCLVVVEQIKSVKTRLADLEKLLPGRAACWTSTFATANKKFAKDGRRALADFPVAICTHKMYLSADSDNVRAGRTFTVVDEFLDAVDLYTPTPADVLHAWEDAKLSGDKAAEAAFGTLHVFVTNRVVGKNKLDRLGEPGTLQVDAALDLIATEHVPTFVDVLRAWEDGKSRSPDDLPFPPDDLPFAADMALKAIAALKAVEPLEWFDDPGATSRYIREHSKTREARDRSREVVGWARALRNNYAFISGESNYVTLIGWDNKLRITGPTIQIDATAGIDGIRQFELSGRTYHPCPLVTYGRLRTVIVTPPSRKWVAEIVKSYTDAMEYRDWAVSVISNPDYLKPGERALVVCKHALTGLRSSDGSDGGRYLPDWDREDETLWRRLNAPPKKGDPNSGPNGFQWDLGDDRRAAITYWGSDNTGRCDWQDCSTVYLFDAAWQRKVNTLGKAQGLTGARVPDTRGIVAGMTSLRNTPRKLERYTLGQLMRQHKQLALRGRARKFDERGRCLPMTLVCGIWDYGWLIENWGTLFPAAPEPELPSGCGRTHAQRFLQFLRDAQAAGKREVTNREIASDLGLAWKVVKKDVLPRIEDLIEELGWRYTPGRGRAPGIYAFTPFHMAPDS